METIKQKMAGFKPNWKAWAIWAGLFAALYGVGMVVPPGFDWVHYFSVGRVHPVWTPWTKPLLTVINWPLVVAVTLFAVINRTYRYNKSPVPIALAVVSLPTIWILFMGNLDGLVLAGLLILPWGVPLASMKPQLTAFALLAKRSSIIAGIVWGLITFIIWGPWPLNFLMVTTPEWKVEWTQDIALFPWGLLITIPLLWFSRGDEDLLMAAGSFCTPHLFPYHYFYVMPALGRMKPGWMWLTWAASWTPLLANWLGNKGWYFGHLLGACVWLGVYFSKEKQVEG